MSPLLALCLLSAVACLVSATLCRALRPLLQRYALARPNARSSHVTPTPQGGGIAVLLGALIALLTAGMMGQIGRQAIPLLGAVGFAAAVLAVIGAWDDIRPLPARFRLLMQTASVALVVLWAAPEIRLLEPWLPNGLEKALVILAGVWFVNLTNFIDGLDWMTVAAIVPAMLALAFLGSDGQMGPGSLLLALAVAGALLGFSPFNRPPAKLFLGDVGALPLGLLLAYLLYRLAGSGALVPALLLPLYSVSDASLTLGRRLIRREKIWEAHRSHFYQRATDNGFSVLSVSLHVLCLNILLAGLALIAASQTNLAVLCGLLAVGVMLTGLLLHRFSIPRSVKVQAS